jgi:hypothetical protein
MHTRTAAINISNSINALIKPEVLPEATIIALEKTVEQLFALLPDPSDETAQNNMVNQTSEMIRTLNIDTLPGIIFRNAHIAVLLCLQASQIAGMAGLIPFKEVFSLTTFSNMLLQQFPQQHIKKQEWFSSIVRLMLKSNKHDLALLMSIYNDELQVLDHIYSKIKEIETDIHIDKPLKFAQDHHKYQTIHHIVSLNHSNTFEEYANKMIYIIRGASASITVELGDVDIENKLAKFIKRLVKTKYQKTHETMIMLSQWNLIYRKPQVLMKKNGRIDNFTHLHQYAGDEANQPKDPQALHCAPTELDMVLDILNTILYRLEDKDTREAFFDHPNEIQPMNAAILCTLSFYLLIMIGNHTHDDFYRIEDYATIYEEIFAPASIEAYELVQWKHRTLHLLNIIKSHPEPANDPFESSTTNESLNHAIDNKKKIKVIAKLIAKSADINAVDNSGYTPLQRSIIIGYGEAFDLLMKQSTLDVSAQSSEHHTAIWYATMCGNDSAVTSLIEKKIVMSEQDLRGSSAVGFTLLTASLSANIPALSNHLMTKEINWAKTDMEGNTPLHYFVKFAPDTAKTVLFQDKLSRYGLTRKNLDGKTPGDMVESGSDLEMTLKKFYPPKPTK